MKAAFILPIVLFVPAISTAGVAPSPDSLFRDGRFAAALAACVPGDTTGNDLARLVMLGRVELMENRVDRARTWLERARRTAPDSASVLALLAEAAYRQNRFGDAARLHRALGHDVLATKLASFESRAPYHIVGGPESRIPFVHTDPLPLIRVAVNGVEANLIIDTGGGELVLDPAFADSVKAVRFGGESEGVFAGGRRAKVEQGRVDSVRLGGIVVENVPVNLLSTLRFSMAANGKPVHGVLGTVLLSRFLATLDYPGGALVLKRRGAGSPSVAASAGSRYEIPFWMDGDHLLLAEGAANGAEPALMLVDTGAAGIGFTCPESTARAAGIALGGEAAEGVGGGGRVSIVPFMLDSLRLGDAKATAIPGVYGAFPASLEWGRGFRVGGLVSHAFFRPYAVTFDFDRMRIVMARPD
jgi:predicted aspartyl protease